MTGSFNATSANLTLFRNGMQRPLCFVCTSHSLKFPFLECCFTNSFLRTFPIALCLKVEPEVAFLIVQLSSMFHSLFIMFTCALFWVYRRNKKRTEELITREFRVASAQSVTPANREKNGIVPSSWIGRLKRTQGNDLYIWDSCQTAI